MTAELVEIRRLESDLGKALLERDAILHANRALQKLSIEAMTLAVAFEAKHRAAQSALRLVMGLSLLGAIFVVGLRCAYGG